MISSIGILAFVTQTRAGQKELEKAYNMAQAAAQASNRCTTKAQCTSEVIGNECGGPYGPIVYSTASAVRVRKIKRLISQANSQGQYIMAENIRNNIPQPCAALMPGTLECRNKTCIITYGNNYG